jgi:hypothetical protein
MESDHNCTPKATTKLMISLKLKTSMLTKFIY